MDASVVDWQEVTQLVLVDSRWKHARQVVEDPVLKLKQLPHMKLLVLAKKELTDQRKEVKMLAQIHKKILK